MTTEPPPAGDASYSGHSSVVHTESALVSNHKEKREEIAKGESKAVFWLRMLVLFLLACSAIAVVVAVYLYMSRQAEQDFETKFHNDANKIYESVGKTLDHVLGSTDAFVVKMLAYAEASNSTWPFVTLPRFGLQATKLLKLARGFSCSLALLVEQDQRPDWNDYVNQSHGWIRESLDVQSRDENWPFEVDNSVENSFVPDIWSYNGPVEGTFANHTNYLPVWHNHPIASDGGNPLNFDMWTLTTPTDPTQKREADSIEAALAEQRVTLAQQGTIVTDPTNEEQVSKAEYSNNWRSKFISPNEDPSEPASSILYPMFNNLESVQLDLEERQQFVGTFVYVFFWRVLIRDILSPESKGIIVVFSNECGPSFTYRLDGPEATFLGGGDLHDASYDYLGKHMTLHEAMETTKSSSYTGIPLSEKFCPRAIHLYPSKDMEDEYMTSDPATFAVAAALIFLFTSTVFVIYDCTVARRQRLVMERALASGAIVSSLFPKQVREKLYEENKQKQQQENRVTKYLSTSVVDVGNQAQSVDDMKVDAVIGSSTGSSSRPIADNFQNTTIFFADLKGFTAWSSKRTPIEVFELLEALYGEFDKIALRRRVFKVETIGDCYVAVTGIPKPQEKHAVIMCRFADDAMAAMKEVTQGLVDRLGEDLMDLDMRVGLYSGSTTAGVLRGDKGRFQLFGDTVNTASRMESNGVGGKIHCSQATADALIAAGKKSWLVPREDQIEAKGLGKLQTWFVNVYTGKARSGMSTTSYGESVMEAMEDEYEKEEQSPNSLAEPIEEHQHDYSENLSV
ncbi:Receptor-type guanylate cyclase gcy [Seminavis robusta]|uniref:Receptor-type guanylate cyclase gcy n=1 Tax=Seminavis robusta TaxID=568900 RepID=A0A9N8EKS5_9STRA|nr:Receptor-type guanylate cyclase gcy [Seminavis robusta]|eukprot:Sro1371_g267100.1 Receptor-type guanylate cyclase gcy (795) ;mRNA; r:18626-21615